jgi:DNA-binding CsgD family transcriptional regulator
MLTNRYLEAVDHCYGALDRPDGLQEFGAYLGAVVGADAGDIVSEWKCRPAIRTYSSFGFDPDLRIAYDDDFLGDNPWFDNLARQKMGCFHTDAADPPDYRNSVYFNEWVRPQGLDRTIGAVLQNDMEKHTWVGFVRAAGRQEFDEEAGFLNALLPHIRRVVTSQIRIDEAEAKISGMNALMDRMDAPAFILDSAGKVDFVNDAGHRFLSEGRGLHLSKTGHLRIYGSRANAQLNHQIHAAINIMAAPDILSDEPVTFELSAGESAAINILPLRGSSLFAGTSARVAVIVTELDKIGPLDIRAFAEIFGLTGTETQLAHWIGQGRSLTDFAANTGIAVSTARWHLRNLETKTETTRIEELVALIQNSRCLLR